MMVTWFRSWHGAPTDAKWLAVAGRAGVSPLLVSAVAWALFDHASQAEDRGSVAGFDPESYAAWAGAEEADIAAVVAAMSDKGIIVAGRLAAWERRQPKREDDSAERVRALRERHRFEQRGVTRGNANVTRGNAPEENRVEENRVEENGDPKGSVADATTAEGFSDDEDGFDGPTYALVDAWAVATKRRPTQLRGRERKETADAFRPIAGEAGPSDVVGCAAFLRSDPFWQEPGKLTVRKLAQTIPEWIEAGRPESVLPRGSPNGPASTLNPDDYKGDAYLS